MADDYKDEAVTLQDEAVGLLVHICYGLEGDDVPFPPELLKWYKEYRKAQKKVITPEVIW